MSPLILEALTLRQTSMPEHLFPVIAVLINVLKKYIMCNHIGT